jgi:Helix-loop-helix DNA-binding domain
LSNTYAPTGHYCGPYTYPRPRANSSPMVHQPPLNHGDQTTYSSPPTQHDRRRAHIISEQKRRESINGGFQDLKHLLTSPKIVRALAGAATEKECAQEASVLLGGGTRDSKAATLRKAVKALDVLAEKTILLQVEVERLGGERR